MAQQADEDLAVADLVLHSAIAVNWAACFHAQQAAEKAIKALLVLHGVDFPSAFPSTVSPRSCQRRQRRCSTTPRSPI